MFESAADGGGINAMKTTFISTRAISEATRLSMLKMQSKLLDAQKEVATGRLADVGKSLGIRPVRRFRCDRSIMRLSRSSTTTSGGGDPSGADPGIAQANARWCAGISRPADWRAQQRDRPWRHQRPGRGRLTSALIDALNDSPSTAHYLFAGINTDVKPVGGL